MDFYDKDLEQALINKRYEQYQKQKINNSDSANNIMNKIKNGYIPNEADVFELCCDDQKKVDEYREMFDIKQRVKDGKISEQDYQFLINKIGINDDYLQSLIKKMFLAKGVFDDGNQTKLEKSSVSKR
ncbi:MAG: hypothetical protein SO108_01810 [Bacilli bacterium]|nr:hypothetical protein [Bacilli bacterium]MDY4996431.1 hypothetical protein [Bacilli bacterium]